MTSALRRVLDGPSVPTVASPPAEPATTPAGTAVGAVERPYLTAVPDCEPPFDDDRSPINRLLQARTAALGRAGARQGTGDRSPTGSVAVGRPAAGYERSARAVRPVLAPRRSLLDTGGAGLPSAPDTVVDAAVPGWCQDADMGVQRTATAELPPAARSGPVLARALVEVLCGQRALPQLRVHCAPDVFAGLQNKPVLRGALGHLLTVRVCEPADGAAEISVVFRRGERVRALAFRMQGVDGRWRITALQTA